MTVSTTDSVIEYVSGGPAFPIPYRFLQNSDIKAVLVKQSGVSETLTGAQYTLVGAGSQGGGTLTSTYAASFLAVAGASLTISREMSPVQPTDLRNQGRFLAETHEAVFDRLTMLVQQGLAGLSRALLRPFGKDYYDAGNRRIANVADPVALQDAATRNWAQTYIASILSTGQGPVNNAANVIYVDPYNQITTVQAALDSTAQDFYPDMFGDIGVSAAGDSAAIQAAIEAAKLVGGAVRGRPGVNYQITTVRIKNGVRIFDFSRSLITPDASTSGVTTGAVQLDGAGRFVTGESVLSCRVSVKMDMVNGGRCAVFADGCRDCVFTGCEIYGFLDHPTINHYGIAFWKASNRNLVYGNKITGVSNPVTRGLLIDFIGEGEAFAGYFANSGATVRATTPCSDNIIVHNQLINGSYGIVLLGCERTLIAINSMTGQNHRSVYMAESCAWTVVANNELTNFLSTAVLLGYGCIENIVIGNVCKREPGVQPAGTGEAVINITTGAQRNLITTNKIYADTNYGIYMGCGMQHNRVIDNDVRGYYVAGIALESDWEASADRPAGALYSRPNYQAPSTVAPGATQWAYQNADSNVIRLNIIREGAPGRSVAAIYLAQVDSNSNLSLTRNIVADNIVFGNADMAYYLYVFEETSGRLVNCKLVGQQFTDVAGPPVSSKVFISRGRLHFSTYRNNDVCDAVVVSFPAGATAPSVSYGARFQTANASATSITTFSGGSEEQLINVRLDQFTTLVHNNALMRLKGSVNAVATSSNNFIKLRLISGVWFEEDRSF